MVDALKNVLAEKEDGREFFDNDFEIVKMG